ncbi:unnamed protein product [Lathyrus sativus]|nr:unnamed protein product [Lathyrus sativus]
MLAVKTVSYRFNVNREYSSIMKAKRGVRQGDPISPYLFVIVMEYLNRVLCRMQQNPDFNHHVKCEKLSITHLTFADDILLFSRGDTRSVEIMMEAICNFTKATGLMLNATKSRIYFGGVEENVKDAILQKTLFVEGSLPFKYLGVPLTTKRLSINHYMILVDKIVDRVRHWSTKLLSYAGRLQLIKSITFAIANYWLQCLPLPKYVLKKINTICRTFLWTSGLEPSNRSPVAWKTVCKPVKYGGMNIINLEIWSIVTMLKLIWNICNKADNMWVRWVHTYYFKNKSVMEMSVKPDSSWIMKTTLKARDMIPPIQQKWDEMLAKGKFHMSSIYRELNKGDEEEKIWRKLMYGNVARPRVIMTLWLICHQRLATKDRCMRYGKVENNTCCFCETEETITHLFFECPTMKGIWKDVLDWIGVRHEPKSWNQELNWILQHGTGKGKKSALIRLAVTETLYGLWMYRNHNCFGKAKDNNFIRSNIIDMITYRGWYSHKLRTRISELML